MTRAPRICSSGLVYCPLRTTDASLESCLVCEWLDEVSASSTHDAEAQAIIRCAPPAAVRDAGAGWIA